jgi:hypothetical protein
VGGGDPVSRRRPFKQQLHLGADTNGAIPMHTSGANPTHTSTIESVSKGRWIRCTDRLASTSQTTRRHCNNLAIITDEVAFRWVGVQRSTERYRDFVNSHGFEADQAQHCCSSSVVTVGP